FFFLLNNLRIRRNTLQHQREANHTAFKLAVNTSFQQSTWLADQSLRIRNHSGPHPTSNT
ncbi:hypothetical protein N7369_23035, partial [Pseudomonas otitidis]|nr:hypothetical protein [Pseudomonas otitidis]